MNILLLLRGLPGAGKTSLASVISKTIGCPVFSVDSYFTDPETGEYIFEYDKNHLAYKQCVENTKEAMMIYLPLILVDNTFTMDWEMEPYFQMAEHYEYLIHVVTVENYHGSKSIHDVTDKQLEKMKSKYRVRLV